MITMAIIAELPDRKKRKIWMNWQKNFWLNNRPLFSLLAMYVFTRPVAFNWWVVSAGHVSRWSAIDHHTWTFLIHPNEIIVIVFQMLTIFSKLPPVYLSICFFLLFIFLFVYASLIDDQNCIVLEWFDVWFVLRKNRFWFSIISGVHSSWINCH